MDIYIGGGIAPQHINQLDHHPNSTKGRLKPLFIDAVLSGNKMEPLPPTYSQNGNGNGVPTAESGKETSEPLPLQDYYTVVHPVAKRD
jgi:hypothetical protein